MRRRRFARRRRILDLALDLRQPILEFLDASFGISM
jgi:hypothetical protein